MRRGAPWRARSRRRRNAAKADRAPARVVPSDWTPYLGRKVSIRYRLKGDERHPFSEAIGVVSAVRDAEAGQSLTILSRKGAATDVAAGDVEAVSIYPA